MGLAGISIAKPGFEQRTFECATCHRIEKVSLPIMLDLAVEFDTLVTHRNRSNPETERPSLVA
jgi:hypothetical protein